eukprot:gene7256-9893_t
MYVPSIFVFIGSLISLNGLLQPNLRHLQIANEKQKFPSIYTKRYYQSNSYSKKRFLKSISSQLSFQNEDSFSSVKKLALTPINNVKNTYNNVKRFFTTQLPMLQYLWPRDNVRLQVYLLFAMLFMFLGKWFNLQVPFILQRTIDLINKQASAQSSSKVMIRTAQTAIATYGFAKALTVVCSEIKTCLFTHVSQNVLRKFANQIFKHLHSLDSEFHLRSPSGVISVAYVRAVRGFQTMLFQLVFSVAPTALELFMVSNILYRRFGASFASITLLTFSLYLAFTVWITQYRVHLRQELVDTDNARNGFFIDSILNHEVVKLFTNEKRELMKFDSFLEKIQQLSIDSTYAIAWLNLGQAALFCSGLTVSLLLSLQRVSRGSMSVGDVIAINSLLLQLAVPFNFIGYTYQELRQSFVDMGYVRQMLIEQQPTILDPPDAVSMDLLTPRNGPSTLEFKNVSFNYKINGTICDESCLLDSSCLITNISFKVEKGQNVAIVGPSGS